MRRASRRTRLCLVATVVLAGALADGRRAEAKAHPHHEHEDIFDESDLLIGFKAGLQTTSFTEYSQANVLTVPQSRMRFSAGAAIKFVYGLPRFEIDILWNARGWVNTENTVNFIAAPFIMKFPLEMTDHIDMEVGPGIQPELTMFGADPHNPTMLSALVSVGFAIDYESYEIDMDFRYVYGLSPVSTFFPGTKTRDVQAMCGVLWHF